MRNGSEQARSLVSRYSNLSTRADGVNHDHEFPPSFRTLPRFLKLNRGGSLSPVSECKVTLGSDIFRCSWFESACPVVGCRWRIWQVIPSRQTPSKKRIDLRYCGSGVGLHYRRHRQRREICHDLQDRLRGFGLRSLRWRCRVRLLSHAMPQLSRLLE